MNITMRCLVDKKIFERNNYTYYLRGVRLIVYKCGRQVLSLNLQPQIDNKIIKLVKYEDNLDEIIYTSECGKYKVIIELKNKEICYFVKTENSGILNIKYFERSVGDANSMRTFASEYDNYITPFDNSTAEIKSRALPWDEDRETKLKSWFFTPQHRAVAIKFRLMKEQEKPWFGVSVPGKLPISKTKFYFTKLCGFEIEFENFIIQNNNGELPRVYFYEDLDDAEKILEKHYNITKQVGGIISRNRFYDWWNRPILTPCSDLITLIRGYHFNYKTLCDFVDFIEEKTGIKNFTLTIDGYWFENVGDYKSVNKLIFESKEKLRECIDYLHRRGHKVILWFSQFRNDRSDPASIIKTDYKSIFDYTKAEVREYIKDTLYFILSDNVGCLNADGIKLDFSFLLHDMEKFELEDLSWGYGDQYRGNVNKFLLNCATSIKEDALISDTTAAPSVALDVIRLNDDWGETISSWVERARKSVYTEHAIIDTDGYEMSRNKYEEYAFVAPVFGVPNFYCVHEYFGNEPLEDIDYKLLRASWNVYMNAPVLPKMKYRIIPEKNIYERYYSIGDLEENYAALLIDGICLVTFSTDKAMLMSKRDTIINIPIPDNREIVEVCAVYDRAIRKKIRYYEKLRYNKKHIIFEIESIKSNVYWYEIKYVKKGKANG